MGPLAGTRVVEIAGIGPGPLCGMLLADLGAEVVRVERVGKGPPDPVAMAEVVLTAGRAAVAVDLKHPEGAEVVLRMTQAADVLLEGFRPGVAERLGIGPEVCLTRNPRLVYGRVTGWGQEGPLAPVAGHDLDYLALSGVLHMIGPADRPPVPPLNLVGDYGGGAMLLAVGILAALVERADSGRGQVVDAAMIDGAALLASVFFGMRAAGLWSDRRGANLLDGGAPFYRVYETADGRFLAVAALEPKFFAELLDGLGMAAADLPGQYDRDRWPALAAALADRIRSKTRDEWAAVFAGSDACVAPVLSPDEAPHHPHHAARGTFVTEQGVTRPAPAPRFSRTPLARPAGATAPPAVLEDWGFTAAEIERLRSAGALG